MKFIYISLLVNICYIFFTISSIINFIILTKTGLIL